jgi:hypothetical protein
MRSCPDFVNRKHSQIAHLVGPIGGTCNRKETCNELRLRQDRRQKLNRVGPLESGAEQDGARPPKSRNSQPIDPFGFGGRCRIRTCDFHRVKL